MIRLGAIVWDLYRPRLRGEVVSVMPGKIRVRTADGSFRVIPADRVSIRKPKYGRRIRERAERCGVSLRDAFLLRRRGAE